jgi:hypothetical protein
MGSRWLLGPLAAITLLPAPLPPAAAVGPIGMQDCLAEFRQLAAEAVQCRLGYRLSAEERDNLAWLTAGALLDAECDLDVAVARTVVATALRAPEVLEVPPQYGECRFTTVAAPLDIDFLLAPTVWFEDGRAIRATPNLHGVRGLPTPLAGVLMQAVNQDPEIEALLVAEVNALLDGLGR